ncbi:hypothetical protein BDZ89DRAFT_70044 [Hymenopellis radicata]|nr:hypothetical protein BDZ89DRAFT_70044 [Hymenopellis radicata]
MGTSTITASLRRPRTALNEPRVNHHGSLRDIAIFQQLAPMAAFRIIPTLASNRFTTCISPHLSHPPRSFRPAMPRDPLPALHFHPYPGNCSSTSTLACVSAIFCGDRRHRRGMAFDMMESPSPVAPRAESCLHKLVLAMSIDQRRDVLRCAFVKVFERS